MEHGEHDKIQQKSWSATASGLRSGCLSHRLAYIQLGQYERVRLTLRASPSEWESPCRGRAFKRSLCWLHFLLEWTQERRAAWSRIRYRHTLSASSQDFQKAYMTTWWRWDFPFLARGMQQCLHWPTQMRLKTSSLMIWVLWFLQLPGQTYSSSSGTSVLEWAQTTKPGKERLELKKYGSATAMASSF